MPRTTKPDSCYLSAIIYAACLNYNSQFPKKYFSLMPIVDFVQKLLSILENEKEVVQWISDGKEFEIIDVETFEKKVLQSYFRHNKFESFIRQLNMYGFHKVNRRKNSYIFEHENFVQDRQDNYCQIKRTKRSRDHNTTEQIKSAQVHVATELLSQRAPKMAEFLQKLIQFNSNNHLDLQKLKSKLNLLAKQISSKKQKNVRPIIKSIKLKIQTLEEIQQKMSTMNWNAFKNNQQEQQKKTEATDRKIRAKSAPIVDHEAPQQMGGFEQVSLNNLCSFKSISSFIAFG